MTRYWFITTKNRKKSRIALLTFLLAFVVLILGCYTRLTDAGLSCPDWPNCYGFITAPHTQAQLMEAAKNFPLTPINVKKAWTEMTHRYLAGIEGILILILSLSIFIEQNSGFPQRAKSFKSIAVGMGLILLLGFQVFLGMLTVTAKLKPVIVLAHLLTGISILSVLWFFYLDLNLSNHSLIKKPSFWFIALGMVIVFMQIGLGGWVAAHSAGLSCIDFPYCNGQWLPPMQWNHLGSDLITIHMLHRIGALITAVYVSFLGLKLLEIIELRNIGMLLLAIIVLQITLGILNIIWLRPLWIALAHYMTAILLFEILLTLLVKVTRSSSRYGYYA